jgi:hypothetical protein
MVERVRAASTVCMQKSRQAGKGRPGEQPLAFMIYLDQGCDELWFRRMAYSCSSKAENIKLSGVCWRAGVVPKRQAAQPVTSSHTNRMFTTGGFLTLSLIGISNSVQVGPTVVPSAFAEEEMIERPENAVVSAGCRRSTDKSGAERSWT